MAKKELTTDEARIIDNLRRMAAEMKYGEIECFFHIHNGDIQHGVANKRNVRL